VSAAHALGVTANPAIKDTSPLPGLDWWKKFRECRWRAAGFRVTERATGSGALRVIGLKRLAAEAATYGAKITLDGSGRVFGLQSAKHWMRGHELTATLRHCSTSQRGRRGGFGAV